MKKKQVFGVIGFLAVGIVAVFLFSGLSFQGITGFFFRVSSTSEINVTIISPEQNQEFNIKENLELNFSIINNSVLDLCFYQLNGGVNTTIVNCSNTLITVTEGASTLTLFVNDTVSNLEEINVSFFTDTIFPEISFINTTAANDSVLNQSFIYVNVSMNDSHDDSVIFSLWNESNEINYIISDYNLTESNWTNLSFGYYAVHVFVNDSFGNTNSVSRFFNLTNVTLVVPEDPECDDDHLNLCDNADDCDDANGYWYDSDCNEDADYDDDDDDNDDGSDGGGDSTTTPVYVPSKFSWENTVAWDDKEIFELKKVTQNFKRRNRIKLKVFDETHYVGVLSLNWTHAVINVTSKPQQAVLKIGEEKRFEVSGDDIYDLLVRLNDVNGLEANVTIESIQEPIGGVKKVVVSSNSSDIASGDVAGVSGTGQVVGEGGKLNKGALIGFGVLFSLILIIVAVALFFRFKYNYRFLKLKNLFFHRKPKVVPANNLNNFQNRPLP
ncbi:hypothetical protein GOV14_00850 [Candidatus Pacearchaeota archaeon]|nr:hypothetical protein [Candidatus Pacearchaeota archaeon]